VFFVQVAVEVLVIREQVRRQVGKEAMVEAAKEPPVLPHQILTAHQTLAAAAAVEMS
jgi:hypothetical protein